MQDAIVKYLKIAIVYIKKYSFPTMIIVIVALFSAAIYRIDTASNTSRDEDYYTTLREEIRPIRYDEETIVIIRELVDPKTSISSDFQPGRNNPF